MRFLKILLSISLTIFIYSILCPLITLLGNIIIIVIIYYGVLCLLKYLGDNNNINWLK